jgi:hypothetical protein
VQRSKSSCSGWRSRSGRSNVAGPRRRRLPHGPRSRARQGATPAPRR